MQYYFGFSALDETLAMVDVINIESVLLRQYLNWNSSGESSVNCYNVLIVSFVVRNLVVFIDFYPLAISP